MLELVLGGLAAVAIVAAVLLALRDRTARQALRVLQQEHDAVLQRFAPVLDVEAEAARVRRVLEEERLAVERERTEIRATAAADAEKARKSLDEALVAMQREQEEARSRLEAEATRVRQQVAASQEEARQHVVQALARQEELVLSYGEARETFDRLQREVSLLEENLEDISFGVYKPHYDYATSQEYRNQLERVSGLQKDLIKQGRHVAYGVAWTIQNSLKEGERMQKQYGKLLLRAFNGECDTCIAKVAWNNVTRMEERIRKGFDAINELGGVMKISVTPEYRELRLQELRLHHELETKRRAEAEEQRRLREQMKEEERAQRELQRAREDAEDEEHRYERALEKARKEMSKAKGAELDELNERVRALQAELEEAHKSKERAISRAQMTRSGHVYIISNVGSFGDDIVKIGMTRRLEPKERIKELGDASVPFEFDVHGMVFSEDAPSLETELHHRFQDCRVNLVNERKEFFRVALKDIDEFLRSKEMKLELTLLAEAREFRETLALRQKAFEGATSATPSPVGTTSQFPDRLF